MSAKFTPMLYVCVSAGLLYTPTEIPSKMFYICVYMSAIYTPRFSLDAFFDVDSDSDLRLELGARLGLAFSRTRAFACFGCGLPVRCAKGYILGAPKLEIFLR